MTRKQKRFAVILGGLAFLGAATGLTFYALGQKASYFYMPADLASADVQPGQRIRLGMFIADSVLAKHDERYMPKEVAEGLKEKGVWVESEGD